MTYLKEIAIFFLISNPGLQAQVQEKKLWGWYVNDYEDDNDFMMIIKDVHCCF